MCLQCRKIFYSNQRLRKHNCQEIKTEITKETEDISNLISRTVEREPVLVCILDCSRRFSDQADLDLHIEAGDHLGSLFFPCNGCPKKFTSTMAMKDHICNSAVREAKVVEQDETIFPTQNIASNKEEEGFSSTFTTQSDDLKLPRTLPNPKIHMEGLFTKEHHKGSKSTFSRQSGDLKLPGNIDMKSSNEEIEEHFCKCGASFPSQILLRRHQMTKHQSNKETRAKQKCDQCNYQADKYQMKNHMSRHSNEKNFICNECGKKFKKAASLKPHMLIHKGEKKYNCEQCGNGFFSRPALINHTNNKHNMTGLHTCNICQKNCPNKYSLREHMGKHTGERKYVCREDDFFKKNLNVFFCREDEHCSKRFRLTSVRQRHEKMHTGIREFKCQKCGKQFVQKSGLVVHMKRHNGTKEHACAACGKAFVEPAGARNCKHQKLAGRRR